MIRFDQIAIAVPNPEKAREFLTRLGFTDWTIDLVTAKGKVGDNLSAVNVADLSFNYDMFNPDRPVEFEVINYETGNNFHNYLPCPIGISHLGYHTEDMLDEKERFKRFNIAILQEVRTLSHSNPDMPKGRHYHYCIFDTVDQCGFYIKAIKRIEK